MAELTAQQIAKVVQDAIFKSGQWTQAGREFAQGMKGTSGFSSQNPSGVAGGRGQQNEQSAKDYRDARKTFETDIKLRKLANMQSQKTTKMMKAFSQAVKVVHPRMKTFKEDISLLSNTLDQHYQQISERFESAADEIKFWEKKSEEAGISLKDLTRNLNKVNDQLANTALNNEERLKLETELLGLEKKRAELLDRTARGLERTEKIMRGAAAAAGIIAGGAMVAGNQMLGDIVQQRRYGTPGGMFQQLKAGTIGGDLVGVDPELMSEQFGRNRQALIAMGGGEDMAGVYERLGKNIKELANITGDHTEAFKFQMEAYQNLTKMGIEPTEAALKANVRQFEFFQKASGMTTDEFIQMQQRLEQNATIRQTLMGLDKKDRFQRIQSINTLVAFNRTMGMTQEQAEAAAIALQELGGKGPRERFKKVAQLQALAAATGVKMTEDARQGFLRGRSATAEQQKAQQSFLDQMGSSLTEISATMGGSATELTAFSMLDKLGMSLSDFDTHVTTLGADVSDLGPNFDENFKRMIDQMSGAEEALNSFATAVQQAKGVVTNVAGGDILGKLATGIGGFIMGKGGLSWLRSGAGGLFRGGAGMVSRLAAGSMLPAAGATVGSAGLATTAGAVGVAGVGGYAAGSLIDNTPRWFGKLFGLEIDNLSTNISQGIERIIHGSGEAQKAELHRQEQEELKHRAEQREMAEKQLLEQQRTNELQEASLMVQQGLLSTSQLASRIGEINARYMTNAQFLVGQ